METEATENHYRWENRRQKWSFCSSLHCFRCQQQQEGKWINLPQGQFKMIDICFCIGQSPESKWNCWCNITGSGREAGTKWIGLLFQSAEEDVRGCSNLVQFHCKVSTKASNSLTFLSWTANFSGSESCRERKCVKCLCGQKMQCSAGKKCMPIQKVLSLTRKLAHFLRMIVKWQAERNQNFCCNIFK